MSKKASLFIFFFLNTLVLSLSTEKVNTDMRLEQLEKELVETKSSLVEILKTISIISKEYVHNDQIERIIKLQNQENGSDELDIKFMSLNEQINDSKKELTNFVHKAVSTLEKQFATLKDDLSYKLDKKVKRDHDRKFVTEEKFATVSKKVEKLQTLPLNISHHVNALTKDLTASTITRNEFAKFQLTVARDTALVKVEFRHDIICFSSCVI